MRISTAELLDAWRAAGRALADIEPGSTDEAELNRVRDDARVLHRERFDQINGHGAFDSGHAAPDHREWPEIRPDEAGA